MPHDASFRFIANDYALSDNGRRIIRSHVATHRPRQAPSASQHPSDAPKQRRKRHKKQKVYELQLIDTAPGVYRPSATTDAALGVTGVDPFESLAISADSYLDPVLRHWWNYFAPPDVAPQHGLLPPLASQTWTRLSLKQDWWPVVRGDTALCYATLLIAAGHLVRIRSPMANVVTSTRLKGQVLALIRAAVEKGVGPSNASLIAAMLSLAGYEFFYGIKSEYYVHMEAIARLVQECGGLGAFGSDIMSKLAMNVGYDVALYAATTPYFRPVSPYAVATPVQRVTLPQCLVGIEPVALPPALTLHARIRSLTTYMLETMRLTAAYSLYRTRNRELAIAALLEVASRLKNMDRYSVYSWSPFQSVYDDTCPVTAGACCRYGCKSFAYHALEYEGIRPADAGWRLSKEYYDDIYSINFGAIRGTYYATVAFWSFFMMRLTVESLPARDIDLLRCYAITLKLKSWSDVKTTLSQCAYVDEVFDAGCKAIWDQVEGAPKTPLPLRLLDLPRTRFDADLALRLDPKEVPR